MDQIHAAVKSAANPADPMCTLIERGFVVIPGPATAYELAQLATAYDLAVARAAPADVRIGRTTTRVHRLASYSGAFEALAIHPPILDACRRMLGSTFHLGSLLARTVHAGAGAQPLHVDIESDGDRWAMIGFIFMVDAFRPDNGATRFVPGSHRTAAKDAMAPQAREMERRTMLGYGDAGSVILYSGSVWHGHSANTAGRPRRSIQGAYIRGSDGLGPTNGSTAECHSEEPHAAVRIEWPRA